MLMPRRQKHRKTFRGRMRGQSRGGNTVAFGDWGIQALEPGWVDSRQIEAARRSITNYVRRGGKVWIRIFPDKPITKKPAETRMGKGKGNPEYFVAVVRPGKIMFELGGVRDDLSVEALTRAAHKLPMRCRIVQKEVVGTAVADEAAAVEAGD